MCISATRNSIKERVRTTDFLNAVHECNSDLPDDNKKSFSSNDTWFQISYHHELINLFYFLKNIQVDSIDSIRISMKDNELSDKEMQQLAPYLVRMNRLEITHSKITSNGFKYI